MFCAPLSITLTAKVLPTFWLIIAGSKLITGPTPICPIRCTAGVIPPLGGDVDACCVGGAGAGATAGRPAPPAGACKAPDGGRAGAATGGADPPCGPGCA